jgi:hypothetical protein
MRDVVWRRERQDSVYNGFKKALPEASVVCIHDSARPLVSQEAVLQVGLCLLHVRTFCAQRLRLSGRGGGTARWCVRVRA